MVARLSLAIVSFAVLATLAVACGGGSSTPPKTPTALVTAAPTPAPTATLTEALRVRPISENGVVWDLVTARVSANVSPLLRPPSPPAGFDTVRIVNLTDRNFVVDYTGPSRTLHFVLGTPNPGLPASAANQSTVTMRGLECTRGSGDKPCPYLQIEDLANPTKFSFVKWIEHGHWNREPGYETNLVEYMVSGEGVEPQFLIDFAKSLTTQ
jgi:hypothetical protein